ncbi:MAG: beta-lactamase family protein [Gammaproteobacteria bacterium]|nr:beta-lactamase family protein [Gammaproteobacteria bacterium]
MDALINQKISFFQEKTKKPLITACVWNNGEFYEASFGKEKNQGIEVFEIGSNGKTFTTTLLAILVRDNILQLNDKLEKFRPELPYAKDITLEQLATHTSGLPANPFKGLILTGSSLEEKVLNFNKDQYETYLAGIKKVYKPKGPKYSNLGMALLGNVLAQSVGLTYEQAVKEFILEPLGMFETHTTVGRYDETRVAKGHSASGKPVPHFSWENMEPAGVWYSTAKDLMVFLKAHLGYSGKNWEELLRTTTQPITSYSKKLQIGLGWVIEKNDQLGNIAFHNGGTFGQLSVIACALEKDLAIALLTNRREKLWHNFVRSHKLDELAVDILQTLDVANMSREDHD